MGLKNKVFMRLYLGPPWTNFHQILSSVVFHHALLIFGIQNAEMQKKFCDIITSVLYNLTYGYCQIQPVPSYLYCQGYMTFFKIHYETSQWRISQIWCSDFLAIFEVENLDNQEKIGQSTLPLSGISTFAKKIGKTGKQCNKQHNVEPKSPKIGLKTQEIKYSSHKNRYSC